MMSARAQVSPVERLRVIVENLHVVPGEEGSSEPATVDAERSVAAVDAERSVAARVVGWDTLPAGFARGKILVLARRVPAAVAQSLVAPWGRASDGARAVVMPAAPPPAADDWLWAVERLYAALAARKGAATAVAETNAAHPSRPLLTCVW